MMSLAQQEAWSGVERHYQKLELEKGNEIQRHLYLRASFCIKRGNLMILH